MGRDIMRLKQLDKLIRKQRYTTRGTRRTRAPKGFWQGIREQVLGEVARQHPERIEELFQQKVKRMSEAKRENLER